MNKTMKNTIRNTNAMNITTCKTRSSDTRKKEHETNKHTKKKRIRKWAQMKAYELFAKINSQPCEIVTMPTFVTHLKP
jgi:hypothetical protein